MQRTFLTIIIMFHAPYLNGSPKDKQKKNLKPQAPFKALVTSTYTPRTQLKKDAAAQQENLEKKRTELKKLLLATKKDQTQLQVLQQYQTTINKIRLMNCDTAQKKIAAIARFKLPKAVQHYVLCSLVPSQEIKKISQAINLRHRLIVSIRTSIQKLDQAITK